MSVDLRHRFLPAWLFKFLLGGALAIAAASWAATAHAASCGFLMNNAFGFAPVRVELHPYLSLPQGTTYLVYLVDGKPVTWDDGTTAIRTTGGTRGAVFVSAPSATYVFNNPGQHPIVLRCYTSATQYAESAAQEVLVLPPPLISVILLVGIAIMFALVRSISRRPRHVAPAHAVAPPPAPPAPQPPVFRQAYWPHGTAMGSPVRGDYPAEYSQPTEPPRLETLGVINPPGVDFVPPPIGPSWGPLPRVTNLNIAPVPGAPGSLSLAWTAPVTPPGLVLEGYALLLKAPNELIGGGPVGPIVQYPAVGLTQNPTVVDVNPDTPFIDLRPVYKVVASGQTLMDPW